MAESLGIDELRAHALTSIGLAKGYLGDQAGATRDIEQALAIAVEANSSEASTIANNLGAQAVMALELARASEIFDESQELAVRFGDAAGARWLRGEQAQIAVHLQPWDEALRRLDEFIGECEAGSPHYSESTARIHRAWIREARDDASGALADLRRAVVLAREGGDPQLLVPALGALVAAVEAQGNIAEARELARETVEIALVHPREAAFFLVFDFLAAHVALEFGPQLRATLESTPSPPVRELALACLNRDFVRAAEIWAGAGSPPWEARLRLRAAEELMRSDRRAEGEAQLHMALEFYRSAGAMFYIRRGERLLAKST